MPDRRSDEQLVAATLAGDREAFGELVARHRESVFAAALRRLGDFESASDATQEAFLKAYLSLAELRDPGCFGAWLCRIAERTAIAALRRREREIPTEGLEVYDARPTRQDPTTKAALARRVRDELSILTEPTRRAMVLYHVNGYSQAEVADRLGLTRSAVKTRLSRARAQLRRRSKTRGRSSMGRSKWRTTRC